MTEPEYTLLLLDKLEEQGFDDDAFAELHHFKEKNRTDTIKAHRAYCKKSKSFQPASNNLKVQQRLEKVLHAYTLAGFTSGRKDVFLALAVAATAEIS